MNQKEIFKQLLGLDVYNEGPVHSNEVEVIFEIGNEDYLYYFTIEGRDIDDCWDKALTFVRNLLLKPHYSDLRDRAYPY